MGKYNHLKVLKKTEARSYHICNKCGNNISTGEIYYREHIEDKFLHSPHAKKYCPSCYKKYKNFLPPLFKK